MKYSTNKSNSPTKKPSIFKCFKNLQRKRAITNNEIKTLKQQLQRAKANNDYSSFASIKEELNDKRKYQQNLNNKFTNIIKRIGVLAVSFGLVLSAATYSLGSNISNDNFNETFNHASNIIQQEQIKENMNSSMDSSDISYEQLKNDIKKYTELSQKDDLNKREKEELSNLKSRINSNPENITQLSLDILKQQIANSLGIDDYHKIKIIDKSTQVHADQFHPESGSKTDISISVDGKTIASLEKFINRSNGETHTSSDTISKDILKVIDKIVVAQSDSQDKDKAIKALKSSINLSEKDISFETEKTNTENDER